MENKYIIVEVGANNGGTTSFLASSNSVVYAFEPTRELLVDYLWGLSDAYQNVNLLPFAVDLETSFKTFNIAGQGDWGCSSLFEFSDNLEQKWPDRPDFKTTHSYRVPTITLFDFCNLYNIPRIDYLHIDAQGSDYNVLLSLKDKISIVKEGVVEASNNVDLYKDVNNRIEDIKTFLIDNGFEITQEYPNDEFSAEVNIHFKRK